MKIAAMILAYLLCGWITAAIMARTIGMTRADCDNEDVGTLWGCVVGWPLVAAYGALYGLVWLALPARVTPRDTLLDEARREVEAIAPESGL